MAIFPGQLCPLSGSYSEEFDPSVERDEMERGVPKQRLVNSQVLVTMKCAVLFRSKAELLAFDSWYFEVIRRIGWFSVTHPRTEQVITARFQGGRLGALTPATNTQRRWRRELTLEYLQ